MSNILEYKGYQAKVEYDVESRVLFGKIEGVLDLVTFEAESAEFIETSFHDAVDDYLSFCAEEGKSPDKPYNGVFNVRIAPDLHRKLAAKAFREGDTLNRAAQNAIEQYVSERKVEEKTVLLVPTEEMSKKTFDSSLVWPTLPNWEAQFGKLKVVAKG